MEEGQLDCCNKMDIINWKQNLDEKKSAGVLSSDMSKTFDSLHSPSMITILGAFYGFSDEVLGLIQSYFCERKCRVRIDPETTNEWYRIFLWATLMECIPKWFALPGGKLNIIHVCQRPSIKLSHASESKKGTKHPRGMTKTFWKVTSPNVTP